MDAIRTDFQPINRITTPLTGTSSYVSSGIIKAVMKNGEKVSVAQIDYQEFDEENFQYVFSPYWEIVDGLPASVFQGIPGIDMDLRLKSYYRVNYIPTFISERTPSESREDARELMDLVGLDYYDRFEWLLRTNMRAANDNLIVERRRTENIIRQFTPDILCDMQYGDKLIVESMKTIGDTTTELNDRMFHILVSGIDVVTQEGQVLVDMMTRSAMVPYMMAQRLMAYQEKMSNLRFGIEQAKKEGKYTGRKPIEVDEAMLRQIAKELDEGIITVEEAMRRTKINSRSTFYRKLRKLKDPLL